MRKTETGCRPDQLFGAWAIEADRFSKMVSCAKGMDIPKPAKADPGDAYIVEDGIARIDVSGPLTKYATSYQEVFGGTSTLGIRKAIREANRDAKVKAILLEVDSPGGTVAGTTDLAAELRKSIKPVYSYISDLGASAAYWISSATELIGANVSAAVGSIGVFMALEDTSGAFEREGVKVHLISTGDFKGAGVDGVPVSEKQLDNFKREVQDVFQIFVSDVATGRGASSAQVLEIADGRMFIGEKARAAGLVDFVGGLDEFISEVIQDMTTKSKMGAVSALANSNDRKAVADVKIETHATQPETVTPEAAQAPQAAPETVAAPVAAQPAPVIPVAVIQPEALERQRCAAIAKMAAAYGVPEKTATAIEAGFTEAQAQVFLGDARLRAQAADSPASPGPGDEQPAQSANGPDAWKAEFEKTPKLLAEFGDVNTYLAYKKAEARGTFKQSKPARAEKE